jgi:hypothetical protein
MGMDITILKNACLLNLGTHLQHAARLPFNTIKHTLLAHLAARISACKDLCITAAVVHQDAAWCKAGFFRQQAIAGCLQVPEDLLVHHGTTADSLRMSAHSIGHPKERQHMNWDSDLYCALI